MHLLPLNRVDPDELCDSDVPALLEGHHHEVTDEVSKKDIVHVFAIAGAPVYGTLGKKWDFHIEWSFLGLVWIVSFIYIYIITRRVVEDDR